ncbi:MAG: S8 family peptidase, partial [Ginsengibacter sp.]
NSPLASKNISNHANFIATIIAGAGNSIWFAKGAAWGARVSSSSFAQVLPDADNYYLQQNISVQNHSYGTVVENDYALNAIAFDKSANNNEELLHVFSSGNSGNAASNSGAYAGISGFANLTGNFKMAKNILTVGAVDSFGNVAPLSSRGPAYDGRIKPELVAFQKNGTSEAAALVSGTALLLQQYYKKENADSVLPSALVKAILVNTADDVNNAGPDFATGFGNMNALRAMDLVKNHSIIKGTITQGVTQSFSIYVPANSKLLKITLAWNDIAASPLIGKALINDLDLEVALPLSGISWRPWVLSPVANADSLKSLAKRKRDSLNNVEEVTIETPVAGNYQININGYNVATGTQKYYVVYSYDSINFFKWQRLTSVDFAEGRRQNILRWENSYIGNGDIEYKFATSPNWLPVAYDVDLSKNYFYWNTPDTISQALLRMKIGNTYFYSDTFFITTLLNPKVGFICNDSILVYWNKIEGINQYQVCALGEKYMEPLLKVNDTSVIISKNMLTDKFIAVAPILPGGITAPKSYAFDYTLQGAGCFINNFFADANGDHASLTLSIGTLYQVAAISFEKQTTSGFVTIFSPILNNQLEYTYNYKPLSKGITYFRAKIILINGQIIYSQAEAVFYVEPGKYLLLPVPVRNSDISLYTTIPDGEIISICDVMGRIVLQKEILFTHEIIKTSLLHSGEYFYRISKKGLKVYSGKLIIL